MFCKYCGNELPDSANFCPLCGKVQTDDPVNDEQKAFIAEVPVETEEEKALKKEKSSMRTTALVLSIISAACVLATFAFDLCALIGIVFAIIAKAKIKAYNKKYDEYSGTINSAKLISTIALIVNIILLVFVVVATILLCIYFGLQMLSTILLSAFGIIPLLVELSVSIITVLPYILPYIA